MNEARSRAEQATIAVKKVFSSLTLETHNLKNFVINLNNLVFHFDLSLWPLLIDYLWLGHFDAIIRWDALVAGKVNPLFLLFLFLLLFKLLYCRQQFLELDLFKVFFVARNVADMTFIDALEEDFISKMIGLLNLLFARIRGGFFKEA